MGFFDTTPSACFIDDLLNFNIDGTEALNDTNFHEAAVISESPAVFASPECEDEEELEWLSNKDVFPSVDTFVPCVETLDDMMSLESSTTATTLKHESPVSVLENGTSSFRSNNWKNSNAVITSCCSGRGLVSVRRPRSKRYRRRLRGGFVNVPSQQWFVLCGRIEPNKSINNNAVRGSESGVAIGKKCKHCGSEKTPQWRAGPDGPKTLCNACGVRYKSGRLFPEYRPANSPTFSNAVHSSSHKKIIEMRKMKLVRNMMVNSVVSG